jgi:hypothetical protein
MATTFFDHQRLSSLGDCIHLFLAEEDLVVQVGQV